MTPTTPTTALDYEAIRQRCPAAFAALIAYRKSANPADETELGQWLMKQDHLHIPTNPRDLYDFFDQQGVWVFLSEVPYGEFMRFRATVVTNRSEWAGRGNGYPTRVEAETAAFKAAFEKLEEMFKLKQG